MGRCKNITPLHPECLPVTVGKIVSKDHAVVDQVVEIDKVL
jgi:hypothetical protein